MRTVVLCSKIKESEVKKPLLMMKSKKSISLDGIPIVVVDI